MHGDGRGGEVGLLTSLLALRGTLRAVRMSKSISRKGLAEMSGVSSEMIYNFETGRTSISLGNLCTLASALGCTVEIKQIQL